MSHVLRMLHWLNLEGEKFPSLSPLIKTYVHWPLPGPPFISNMIYVCKKNSHECMYKLKDCSLHVNQQSIFFFFSFSFFYHIILFLIFTQQGMKSGLTIIKVFRLDNFGVRVHKFCQTLQSCQQFCHKQ